MFNQSVLRRSRPVEVHLVTTSVGGSIVAGGKTLLITGLLVGAGGLGVTGTVALDDVALVDGISLISLCKIR